MFFTKCFVTLYYNSNTTGNSVLNIYTRPTGHKSNFLMKKITLIGTLGKDAEIKNFGGRDALSFSIAVNSGKGDNKITEWFSILSSQTNLQPYLNKGTKIYVEGTFKLSVYNEQAQCSISATQIQLLGGGQQQQAIQTTNTPTQTPVTDDLPF